MFLIASLVLVAVIGYAFRRLVRWFWKEFLNPSQAMFLHLVETLPGNETYSLLVLSEDRFPEIRQNAFAMAVEREKDRRVFRFVLLGEYWTKRIAQG